MARNNSLSFTFNGVTSGSKGLRVTKLPDIRIGEERGRSVEIPGRDGALWLSDNSYKPVTMKIEFEIGNGSGVDINAITAWLSGSGNLILSSFSDYYWKARVIKGFDLVSGIFASGNYITSVEFQCEPFRYLVNEQDITITQASVFTGSGTHSAKPVITINGSGNINLMVNTASVLVTGVVDSITIDCDAMIAYKGDVNLNSNVTIMSDDDAWPVLVPGSNEINWSVTPEDTGSTQEEAAASGVTSVVIQPHWRWR